jgi:hypothetical protein
VGVDDTRSDRPSTVTCVAVKDRSIIVSETIEEQH